MLNNILYILGGDSGIFDYSSDGNMKSIIKGVNIKDRDIMWTKEEMLRYAWQVSAALKDAHDIGSINGSPAIAHTDIDIDQILWIDEMFKVSLSNWYNSHSSIDKLLYLSSSHCINTPYYYKVE